MYSACFLFIIFPTLLTLINGPSFIVGIPSPERVDLLHSASVPEIFGKIPRLESVPKPADSGSTSNRKTLQPHFQRTHLQAVRRSPVNGHPQGIVQPVGSLLKALPHGWLMKFNFSDSGIAVQVAAAYLEDFYLKLLEHLVLYANPSDAMQTLSLVVHDLCLDFEAGGPVISRDIVQAFVQSMMNATRRGFTGIYTAIFCKLSFRSHIFLS